MKRCFASAAWATLPSFMPPTTRASGEYALRMPAFRVLANTPAPQGSTGITTNVFPAMTLGCGAVAGNSTSDNVGPLNLINIKRLAYMTRKAGDAFESREFSEIAAVSSAHRPPDRGGGGRALSGKARPGSSAAL